MERDTTRRALLGALVSAGLGAGLLSPASQRLDQFAPLSGSVWGTVRFDRADTVESPYGPAQLRYDDTGVAGVSADDEQALYYAVGYAQATDRLFQMDLQRRLYRGQLSAVVGEATVESDRFHRKMAFAEAAAATADGLEDTAVYPLLEAYRDGVNEAMEREQLPIECRLLGYEPDPWTVTDSIVVEKIIAWQLTGSFRTLKRALARDRFGEEMTNQVFRSRFEETVPVIREGVGRERFGEGLAPTAEAASGDPVDASLVSWLDRTPTWGRTAGSSVPRRPAATPRSSRTTPPWACRRRRSGTSCRSTGRATAPAASRSRARRSSSSARTTAAPGGSPTSART